jgi:hypothetical protein
VASAESSIEEGHSEEAVPVARTAIADLKVLGLPDDESAAYVVLVRALLASGKVAEASQTLRDVGEVVAKSHDRAVQFGFAFLQARVTATMGDKNQARGVLAKTVAESTKDGFFGKQLEARLTLAGIEIDSRNMSRDDCTALSLTEGYTKGTRKNGPE